jgi:hypothetical protein
MGLSLGSSSAIIAAVVATHFVPVTPLIFLVIPVAESFGHRAARKELARAEVRHVPFTEALSAISNRARELADDIIRNDLVRLAQSPLRADILNFAPRVREAFAEAFARPVSVPVAAGQTPPPAASPSSRREGSLTL